MTTGAAVLDRVLLTDDEVLALALQKGVSWPTAIPTVDVRDEDEVRRAGARGLRSLLVRSIAGEELPGPRLEPLVTPVLDGTGFLATYAADRELVLVPTVVSTAHYADRGDASGSQCITEVVALSGIHQLRRGTTTAAHEATVRLLQVAFESESLGADTGRPAWVCAVGPATEDALRMAVARRGELRIGRRHGSMPSQEDLEPVASAEDALRFLTGAG